MASRAGLCIAVWALGSMASALRADGLPAASSVIAAVGDTDGVVRVYEIDILGGGPVLLWQDNVGSAIHGLDFSADDQYLLIGASNSIALYETDGDLVDSVAMGVHAGTFFLPDNHPVAISADGSMLVAATTNPAGVALCFNDGNSISCLFTDSLSQARSVDISDDGSWIIAGGSSVRYYGALLVPIFTDAFSARIVSIAADGQTAIAGQQIGGHARVYTPAGLAVELSTLPSIVTVAMSGDGTRVATGNDDPGNSAGAMLDVYDDGGNGWDPSDATPFCGYDATSFGNADIRTITMARDGDSVAIGGTTYLLGHARVFSLTGGGCERVSAAPFLGGGALSMDMTFDGSVVASIGIKRAWIHMGSGAIDPLNLHTLPPPDSQPPYFNVAAITSGRGTPVSVQRRLSQGRGAAAAMPR